MLEKKASAEPLEVPVHDLALTAQVEKLTRSIGELAARPHAVPMGVGTGRWVLAAGNTLYQAPLTGAQGGNWRRVVHKMILSVSAAATVVIGSNAIRAGEVCNGEIVRLTTAAAGVLIFDFGEGLPPEALPDPSQFLVWASAPVTIDVWMLHE